MNKRIYKSPLGFSKYKVSHDGQSVINIRRCKELKFQYNKGNGYAELSLPSDSEGQKRVGVHRLVGLAHLKVPDNYKSMTVNHKDGVKPHNHALNLEWATYQENQEHAGKFGLTTKCTPVTSVVLETGELTNFPSILKCAEWFGVSKDIMNARVKTFGRYPIGGCVFVKTADLAEFLVEFNRGTYYLFEGQKLKPVWVKDLSSGEVMSFKSRGDLAAYFKVSIAAVSGWMKDRTQVIIADHYLLKQNEDEPWREFNSPIDKIRLRNCRPVVLINETTGEKTVYPSSIDCCRKTDLSPTCVNYRLSTKGGRVFSDGNRYVYKDELDTVRLPPGNR